MTLDKMVGKRFRAIFGSVYFESIKHIGEEFNQDDILDLCLFFEDNSMTLKGNSSGDAILTSYNDELESIDMQENGYIKVLKLTKYFKLNEYLDCQLLSYQHIEYETLQAGIILNFENDKKMIVINLGDQVYLFKSLPNFLLNEGYRVSETD